MIIVLNHVETSWALLWELNCYIPNPIYANSMYSLQELEIVYACVHVCREEARKSAIAALGRVRVSPSWALTRTHSLIWCVGPSNNQTL